MGNREKGPALSLFFTREEWGRAWQAKEQCRRQGEIQIIRVLCSAVKDPRGDNQKRKETWNLGSQMRTSAEGRRITDRHRVTEQQFQGVLQELEIKHGAESPYAVIL